MTRFRVATYNVHKCKGMDWRVSWERVAKVIRHIDADIIALQEITEPQAREIAARLEMPLVFASARQHKGEPYGNAMMSRLAVTGSRSHDITIRGYEPRLCLQVSLEVTPTLAAHVFAVHLGTSIVERRGQARLLLSNEILDSPEVRGARIVAGDFNEWKRGLATQLLSQHLQSADLFKHLKRRRTYPGVLPFLHLDHIYYDRVFDLREMHLQTTAGALLASDHLPLVADFEALG